MRGGRLDEPRWEVEKGQAVFVVRIKNNASFFAEVSVIGRNAMYYRWFSTDAPVAGCRSKIAGLQ